MSDLYYRMARDSGDFTCEQMRKVAYLAEMNYETWKTWRMKRASEWSISLSWGAVDRRED